MNCDQVFAYLTSGPFPRGSVRDFAVDDHLDRCPSCARIAEALRPAHDLFHESLSPAETRGLPGYWGDAAPSESVYEGIANDTRRKAEVGGRLAELTGGSAALAARSSAACSASSSWEARQSTAGGLGIRSRPLRCFAGLMATAALVYAAGLWWPFG